MCNNSIPIEVVALRPASLYHHDVLLYSPALRARAQKIQKKSWVFSSGASGAVLPCVDRVFETARARRGYGCCCLVRARCKPLLGIFFGSPFPPRAPVTYHTTPHNAINLTTGLLGHNKQHTHASQRACDSFTSGKITLQGWIHSQPLTEQGNAGDSPSHFSISAESIKLGQKMKKKTAPEPSKNTQGHRR